MKIISNATANIVHKNITQIRSLFIDSTSSWRWDEIKFLICHYRYKIVQKKNLPALHLKINFVCVRQKKKKPASPLSKK